MTAMISWIIAVAHNNAIDDWLFWFWLMIDYILHIINMMIDYSD